MACRSDSFYANQIFVNHDHSVKVSHHSASINLYASPPCHSLSLPDSLLSILKCPPSQGLPLSYSPHPACHICNLNKPRSEFISSSIFFDRTNMFLKPSNRLNLQIQTEVASLTQSADWMADSSFWLNLHCESETLIYQVAVSHRCFATR